MTEHYKNEADLVVAANEAIRKTFIKHPVYNVKINGGMYQESGIPDVLYSVYGLFVGIEYKHQKPGESLAAAVQRTTVKQRQHIHRIVTSGGMAGTSTSIETSIQIIKLAILKAKMIARGDDPSQYPLPPYWDELMNVPEDRVVAHEPVEVSPVPLNKARKN